MTSEVETDVKSVETVVASFDPTIEFQSTSDVSSSGGACSSPAEVDAVSLHVQSDDQLGSQHTFVRSSFTGDDLPGGWFNRGYEMRKLEGYDVKKTTSELPPNIYSAIIVSSTIKFGDNHTVNRLLDGEIFFLALANIIVQFIAVYFAYKLYADALAENDFHSCGSFQTSRNLRWMAVAIWSFSLLNDIYETYRMQLWISYAFGDNAASWFRELLENYVDGCICFRASYWLVPPQMRQAELVDANGDPVTKGNMVEIKKALRGASFIQQVFVKVVVLGVKYFVALVLAVVGTGWLVQSGSNEDLLLNCIALEFILQLSGNCYSFFLSSELKRFVEEDAPKFQISYHGGATQCHRATGIIKKTIVLIIFSVACNQLFCRESANFTLDWFGK